MPSGVDRRTWRQPQAAEPRDCEDDFGADFVAFLVVPELDDESVDDPDVDEPEVEEVDGEDESEDGEDDSEDELPEPLDGTGLPAESLRPPAALPESETLPLRDSLRESLR